MSSVLFSLYLYVFEHLLRCSELKYTFNLFVQSLTMRHRCLIAKSSHCKASSLGGVGRNTKKLFCEFYLFLEHGKKKKKVNCLSQLETLSEAQGLGLFYYLGGEGSCSPWGGACMLIAVKATVVCQSHLRSEKDTLL